MINKIILFDYPLWLNIIIIIELVYKIKIEWNNNLNNIIYINNIIKLFSIYYIIINIYFLPTKLNI